MDHAARARRTPTQRTLHVLFPILAHRHHRRYEGTPHHFIIDTVLSAAIFVLIGWNIFLVATRAAILLPSADIAVAVPDGVASGSMIGIDVLVKNKKETLTSAIIEIAYPTTFFFSSASHAPMQGTDNRWEFRDIEPNEEVRIAISGQIVGAPESDQAFKTVLAAQTDSGTIARFHTGAVRITAPALTVTLTGPSAIESGASASFMAVVTNRTEETLHDVTAVLDGPTAFSLTNGSPPASSERAWTFATLAARQATTITFAGTVASAEALDTSLTIHAGLRAGTEIVAQDSVTLPMTISPAPSAETVVTQPSSTVQFATEARYTSTAGMTVGFGPVPPKVGETTGFRIFLVLQNPGTAYNTAVFTATLPSNVSWIGNAAAAAGGAITYDPSSRTVRWTVDPVRPSIAVLAGGFDVSVTPTKADVGNGVALLSATTVTLSGAAPTTVRAPALSTTDTDLGAHGRVVR